MEFNSFLIRTIASTVTIGLVGTTMIYIYNKICLPKRITFKPFVPVGVVKKLLIYPIKSLKPIECDQLNVKSDTVPFWDKLQDRSFVIVNHKNVFLTQRSDPKLVLLDVQLTDNNQGIRVTSPSGDSTTIPLTIGDDMNKDDLKIVATKIWNDSTHGIDCGPEVSKFFSNYLDKPDVRLLRFVTDLNSYRPAQVYIDGKVSTTSKVKIVYQDQAPILVINDKSVETLNSLLTEGSISYRNFRPNVLIEAASFDEDNWEKAIIGSIQLQQLKKCTRCTMTTVDIDKGTFNNEPMIAMRKYRSPQGKDSGYHSPLMGIHFTPETSGTIKIGDPILASHKL